MLLHGFRDQPALCHAALGCENERGGKRDIGAGVAVSTEEILVGLTLIVVLGASAQWLGWRLRIPAILILLLFGFLAGPVTGVLEPDELLGSLLSPIVGISVGLILFEGGLSLRLSETRMFGGRMHKMISVAPFITWGLCAAAAYLLLDLSGAYAILLGAILIVSGPTVVVPLLEFVRPSRRVEAVLKWEAITIDPIGATIGVLTYHALVVGDFHSSATIEEFFDFLMTIGMGALVGFIAATILVIFLARNWIPEGLDNLITLAYVTGAYTISEVMAEESGLMAATIMGVTLANQKFVNVEKIVEFKENLRVILISMLFIILTARLTLSQITDDFTLRWFAFLLVLLLIVRPIVVAIGTYGTALTRNEKIFMSWMSPRGIVAASTASTFALGLQQAGFLHSERLVALTFLTIVGTVLVYGLTALPLARRLNLLEDEAEPQAEPARQPGSD